MKITESSSGWARSEEVVAKLEALMSLISYDINQGHYQGYFQTSASVMVCQPIFFSTCISIADQSRLFTTHGLQDKALPTYNQKNESVIRNKSTTKYN